MTDGIDIQVEDRFSPALEGAFVAMRAGLLDAAASMSDDMLAQARALASDVVLKLHSGRYRDSLYAGVKATPDGVTAYLASNAPEAGILEYGGQTSAHDIFPSVATALRFDGGAGAVYAAVVHDPGAKIGPHPVLHPALDSIASEILARFGAVAITFARSLS